jgi:hypothetical protein
MNASKLIDVDPDLTVKAHSIAAIKRGASEGQSVVFLKGCGPLDGFVVEIDFDTAVKEWEEALDEED